MKLYFALLFFLCRFPVCGQTFVEIDDATHRFAIAHNSFSRSGDDFFPFSAASPQWHPITGDKVFWQPFVPHWFYCKLINRGTKNRSFKLWLNNVQAGVTQLYTISGNHIDSSFKTGSLLKRNERATEDRLLSLPVQIKAGETTEIYLKSYRRQIGITITPLLIDTLNDSSKTILDYWLIFGLSLMSVICIIAVNIYYSFRSKELAWFSAYTIAVLLYSVTVSGFGSLYLWGHFPLFEENAAVFFGAIATASLFQLSRLLFNTKMEYRKIDRFLSVFNIVNLVVALLGFNLLINYFNFYTFSIFLLVLYLLQVLGYCIIFSLSLMAVFKSNRREFSLIALVFGVILFAVCILIMQETGVIKFDYRFHSYMIAFALFPQTLIPLMFFVNRVKKQLHLRNEQIIKERVASERKLLNERLRLGQELHDDMGSTMSGIKLYSHLATDQLSNGNHSGLHRSLQIIQQSSEEMILRISDQVWLIQHEEQRLETVLQRLVDYAGKMTYSKSMEFVARISQEVKNDHAKAGYKNLYLLCKEAINNAVKYSQGTQLVFSVSKEAGSYVFNIRDNGVGFDTAVSYAGNGIKNMQQRATAIHSQLKIESTAGRGTSLTLIAESLNGV